MAKSLHWIIASLVLAQLALGWLSVAWRLSPAKLDLFVWHKSVGLLVLLLVCIRVLWRLTNPIPRPPADMPLWERRAAHATHLALYAILIAMPISGWVINSTANIPFKVFWALPLPSIAPPDKVLEAYTKLIHLGLFGLLAALLIMHIAAALRHHLVRKDDILSRMLPRSPRT
ncbi:MAG TPA: cytochrome b [Gammaproteobacteria bacterium]|nr:cytochrome b [Gammaproteobacteria bacterium]